MENFSAYSLLGNFASCMNNVLKSLHVLLVLGMLASVILWMPFGMGYYGWPWQRQAWRVVLYAFVFALPIGASVGCFAAFRGGFSFRRFCVPFLALLSGLLGVLAMLDCRSRYVEPMLHGSHPHPSPNR